MYFCQCKRFCLKLLIVCYLVVAKKILSFKILSNYEFKSARTADETMADHMVIFAKAYKKGSMLNIFGDNLNQ